MQLQTPMKTIENLQRCIKDSNHIVAILGIEMLVESGGRNFDSNEEYRGAALLQPIARMKF